MTYNSKITSTCSVALGQPNTTSACSSQQLNRGTVVRVTKVKALIPLTDNTSDEDDLLQAAFDEWQLIFPLVSRSF